MSEPKNPQTVLVQNKYYPNGLKEIDVWNYYQTHKGLIMKEVRLRDVVFVIVTDLNKYVIRRNLGEQKFIKLMNSNFDELMTGRTITVYSVMKHIDDIFIIDIDTDNFNDAKKCTRDIYNELTKFRMIDSLQIRFTGKTSFHIKCDLNRRERPDQLRNIFESYLRESGLHNQYTILPKRTQGRPNIDLWASNKPNGLFITLNSLSVIGLKCLELSLYDLNHFQPEHAKIIVS